MRPPLLIASISSGSNCLRRYLILVLGSSFITGRTLAELETMVAAGRVDDRRVEDDCFAAVAKAAD